MKLNCLLYVVKIFTERKSMTQVHKQVSADIGTITSKLLWDELELNKRLKGLTGPYGTKKKK